MIHELVSALPRIDWEIDDQGVTSAHPFLPPIWEIGLQSIATLTIVFLLVKFGGPSIKRFYRERTERIQNEMDSAAEAQRLAEADAESVRASLGDIEAERTRMLAEAEQQATALLAEGRVRIDEEVAALHGRTEVEIASWASRSGDELRSEIAVHASRVVDVVVEQSIDEALQQQLIEDFITRVGAGQSPVQGG
jgi:F-type H+-transporting ATPase subunit b